MATSVPAGLKTADISRFAIRAGQLEKAKPIASYWCNYWIVNQILSKALHNTDQECLSYTSTLMDQLEKFKEENVDEPAVADDVVGKAYIEQFGLETFTRADNAVRANKASRQTADTFQAAATFLDLLAIWGPIEPEITTKAKYAKFHAVRIAKAIKAGEDPNLSNPAPMPAPDEAVAGLNQDDAAVQKLDGDGDGDGGDTTKPRIPSVVEVADDSDETQRALAHASILDQSLHPSRDASVGPAAPSLPPQLPHKQQRQASVTEVPDVADRLSARLAQQSYFDQSLHPSRAPSLPRAKTAEAPIQPLSGPAPSAPLVDLPSPPAVSSLPTMPSLPTVPTSQSLPSPPAVPSLPPGPPQIMQQLPSLPPQQPVQPALVHTTPTHLPQHAIVAAPAVASVAAATTAPVIVDEEAMAAAQKHARWAISALNFEDVPTAILELRAALADLGG
ncbi:hypothetical protein DV736_g5154, partial [Chaetothyriales sp. CBS 134916]